ncbi:MAG: hypothetical protein GY754_08310 [bacterium]|nr:hypothetical protein [bacterium]
MAGLSYEIIENKVIIHLSDRVCENSNELLTSPLFIDIVKKCVNNLKEENSYLLDIFDKKTIDEKEIGFLLLTLKYLSGISSDLIPNLVKESAIFFRDKNLFKEFIKRVYDFWRNLDRFIIADSTGKQFSTTIEHLTDLIRRTYRDIEHNLTGRHPNIYRQIEVGAELAAMALPNDIPYNSPEYEQLNKIPIIREALLFPPLILTSSIVEKEINFKKINYNPLKQSEFNSKDWLCYPAKAGSLLICVYIYKDFYEAGLSLCNLFKIADAEELNKKPGAIFLYGMPENNSPGLPGSTAVFYEDSDTDILVMAVPGEKHFGYLGTLKNIVFTLHNIKMLKTGRFPFHGLFFKVILNNNIEKQVLLLGDAESGGIKTLNALRLIEKKHIRGIITITHKIGSLEMNSSGEIKGYGSGTGAFLRLKNIRPGLAFDRLDMSIILNPNKEDASIVLPIATYDNLTKGHSVDYIFFANADEDIPEENQIIEQLHSPEDALRLFKNATYFANIFEALQYKNVHEELAAKYFKTFFENGIDVGLLRTRSGLRGWETKGPEAAAKELLALLCK